MSSIAKLAYVILTAAIGWAFIYSPMGDLQSLIDQKQGYSNSLATIGNIETKKNELVTKFGNISEEEKKDIETFLPSSLNFVRLISQIDSIAANHGISIDKISSKDTTPAAGEPVEGAQPPQGSYNKALISFSFLASYDAFNAFMSELEKSMRILDINSVKLTVRPDGTYLYDVQFETYWLK
jgi:Tfp pilus assembly protein PilO